MSATLQIWKRIESSSQVLGIMLLAQTKAFVFPTTKSATFPFAMMLSMFCLCFKHDQIFNPIVVGNSVDVVNDLFFGESPSKMTLHNPAVLSNVSVRIRSGLVRHEQEDVASIVFGSSAIPMWMGGRIGFPVIARALPAKPHSTFGKLVCSFPISYASANLTNFPIIHTRNETSTRMIS